MTIRRSYRFHSIRFNGPQFGGTTTLGGVSQGTVSNNPEVVQDFVDGNPFPSLVTCRSFAQEAVFTTMNVARAIELIGMGVSCLEPGSSIDLFYGQIGPCNATFIPGAVHKQISMGSDTEIGGMVYFQNLNTDHRGDSQYSFMVLPQFDGVNNPITITNDVALPAGPIDSRNRFTLGPLSVDNFEVIGKKAVNIESGISVERDAADSSVYDEFFSLSQAAQKVSVNGILDNWFDTAAEIGLNGRTATHVDSRFVLRKRLNGDESGFHPPADNEHILITMAGKAVPVTVAEHSDTNKATQAFDIYGEHDGTNVPLVALTNQSYTPA